MSPAVPESETVHTIVSHRLGNERTVWVRKPRSPGTAAHLTIFLDGELYRERVGANEVIDLARDTLADSWFVFVSMESVEARWRECPCHSPFAEFITAELLPWLYNLYAEMKPARHRTLVGLSYTGLAAAFIAKACPGIFQTVISQSGSFWWNDCDLIKQFELHPDRIPTNFYLDVGRRETKENLQHREGVLQRVSQIEGVQRFRAVLLHRGHAVRYITFDGGHEFAAWKQTLPDALRWALPARTPVVAVATFGKQKHIASFFVTYAHVSMRVRPIEKHHMNRRKRTQFWGANEDDDRLVREILTGHKTATVCKADEYYLAMGEFDDGCMEVGDLVDVYDLKGRLRCAIRITDVYPVRFGDIPEKLWRGECCTSAEHFREVHRACWPQYSLTDDFEMMATHFTLAASL